MNNFAEIITSHEYINLLLDSASKHLETACETGFSTFIKENYVFHSKTSVGTENSIVLPDIFDAYYHNETVEKISDRLNKKYLLQIPFHARTTEIFNKSNVKIIQTESESIENDIQQIDSLHIHPTESSCEGEITNIINPSVMRYDEKYDSHFGDLYALFCEFEEENENPIQSIAGINNTRNLEINVISIQHKKKFDRQSLEKKYNTLKRMTVRTNNTHYNLDYLDINVIFTYIAEKILDTFEVHGNDVDGLAGTKMVAKTLRDTGFYNATVFQYKNGKIWYNNKEMRMFEMP